MDILLIALTSLGGLLAGGAGVHFLRAALIRKVQNLVLEGSRFHLAALPSGSVELRSGARREAMTQKEAATLASGLRTLTSKVHRNPFFGLRLLGGNHADADGRSIEDSFAHAAIESQRRELILLSEERAVSGAVPLIKATDRDEDFEKLRRMIEATEFGGELPVSTALQLKAGRATQELEPLVLWSSQGVRSVTAEIAPAINASQLTFPEGHIPDGEIAGMPGYVMATTIRDRGKSYAQMVITISHRNSPMASENFYLNSHSNQLEKQTQLTKRKVLKQVQNMLSMGVV
jgi:hypothetical protein